MKKEDLVEWIIENGKYLLTIRDNRFKVNLYQVGSSYWEIYFDVKLARVSRAGIITRHAMKKYLDNIIF